mgnify:FL=1
MADETGVSFDQLIGLVTAVQEKTQRGGAVISTALRNIFTRLESQSTIDQLRLLGVAINDTQTSVEKLQTLSTFLETADASTAAFAKSLAAGKQQID